MTEHIAFPENEDERVPWAVAVLKTLVFDPRVQHNRPAAVKALRAAAGTYPLSSGNYHRLALKDAVWLYDEAVKQLDEPAVGTVEWAVKLMKAMDREHVINNRIKVISELFTTWRDATDQEEPLHLTQASSLYYDALPKVVDVMDVATEWTNLVSELRTARQTLAKLRDLGQPVDIIELDFEGVLARVIQRQQAAHRVSLATQPPVGAFKIMRERAGL